MPVVVQKTETLTFRPAGHFRYELHVSHSLLLFLVATSRVRVKLTSTYPVYCVEDADRYLSQEYPRDAQSRAAANRRRAAQQAAITTAGRGVASA